MGAGLYAHEPAFRADVDQCCDLLQQHIGVDLRPSMFAGDAIAAPLNGTWLAQPAVFVIEYTLARLLMSWGIVPQAVTGYGVGEFAAATIGGRLSLTDALRLVAGRARLIDKLPSGAMLAVLLPEQELAALIGPGISVAIAAGPRLTVVSGREDDIVDVEVRLKERDIVSRRLQTTHAFHSTMMEGARDEFAELLKTVTLNEPQIPCMSNLTGTWLTPGEATDAAYWARHMCQTVRFGDGLAEILTSGDKIFVEVGPGEDLASLVTQHLAHTLTGDAMVVATMKTADAREDDEETLLGVLGKLWVSAVDIDWHAYHSHERRRKLPLPTYPFERRSFWLQATVAARQRFQAGIPSGATNGGGQEPDLSNWFYVPVWKPSRPLISDRVVNLPAGSPVLVFTDDSPLSVQIISALTAASLDVMCVRRGETFSRDATGVYTIVPTERSHYARLFAELSSNGRLAGHMLHLWSMTPRSHSGSRTALAAETVTYGSTPLIFAAQALQDTALEKVDILVVTNGMVKVTGAETAVPEKALLNGPCRCLGEEYPRVSCRALDVVIPEPGSSREEDLVETVVNEMACEDSSDALVACRGNERWVQAFERITLDTVSHSQLRRGGVYAITGGLGPIGLAIADHLARTMSARVALIDRSALPPRETWSALVRDDVEANESARRVWQISAIEELGSPVLLVTADVSDPHQMRETLRHIVERFGGIDGIFHVADSHEAALLPVQAGPSDTDGLTRTVRELLSLDEVLRDVPLDFALLISSIGAAADGRGRIDRCAAGAYLDAYATATSSRRRPVLSIHSGAWLSPNGIRCEEGTDAVFRILHAGLPHVIVCAQDLHTYLQDVQSCTATVPRQEAQVSPSGLRLYPRPALGNLYVPPAGPVQQKMAAIWQDLLGIDQIGVHDNFFELGGHSLLAVRVFARMRTEFPIALALRSIFELPTIESQAAMISELSWMAADLEMGLEPANLIEGEI